MSLIYTVCELVFSMPARMAVSLQGRHAPHRTIAWQFTPPHAREKLAHLSHLAHAHLTEHL
jgi:hypothetical protein